MPLLLHRIGFDLVQLEADGCQLATPHDIFHALMGLTNGDPCKGCAYFKDGACPAYQKYHSVPNDQREEAKLEKIKNSTDQSGLIGGKWLGMSSKQIREKEGISPAEFQRRKLAGKYKGD